MMKTKAYIMAATVALGYSMCGLSAQDSIMTEASVVHRSWTLEECIDYALEHNIEIKRQELASEDKQTALSEARWSYAPTFSAGSSYSLSSGRVLDETTYDFVENETVGSSSVSVSGSMEIFAGLRKHRELQRAKIDLRSGLQDLESARYDLRANVTAAFLEVLCARESITEARQIVSMLEVQEEKTRIKAEAGKMTEADLLQIRAQLYSAQNDVLTAMGDYDMARVELCQMLEVEDFRSFDVEGTDVMPAMVPEMAGNISEMVSWRPEIKSAELAVELARKDLQIARSSYWPTVSLSAGYGTNHSGARQMMLQNPDGTFRYEAYPFFRQYADNASSYVSVSLNIPILSGLSVRKNVRRSKTALRDAEYALAATRKGIVKEYLQTEIDARTAYEKFLVARRQVMAAEEAARQVTVRYESGAADVITYSTAVSELATARYQMLSAKYECAFKQKIQRMFISNHIMY